MTYTAGERQRAASRQWFCGIFRRKLRHETKPGPNPNGSRPGSVSQNANSRWRAGIYMPALCRAQRRGKGNVKRAARPGAHVKKPLLRRALADSAHTPGGFFLPIRRDSPCAAKSGGCGLQTPKGGDKLKSPGASPRASCCTGLVFTGPRAAFCCRQQPQMPCPP